MAADTNGSPHRGARIARSGVVWRSGPRPVWPHRLHQIALAAYERMIGLDLDDLSVDGSITKAFRCIWCAPRRTGTTPRSPGSCSPISVSPDTSPARASRHPPIQAGKRWVVERTRSWVNGYGKLRRVTDRADEVIEFYTFLAAAITLTRCLLHQA